jgi:hypothetical protein
MATHAVEYVRVRNANGTLSRNLPAVEEALRKREDETDNGDLTGVLLLFARDSA